MLLDFDVKSCSRQCAVSQCALEPGDVYFSVLVAQEADIVRWDYSCSAWPGPPTECLGWWRSRLPTKEGAAPQLAPTDVMLNLFATLADRPADAEFRYLLGLLLFRRKVLRREDCYQDAAGRHILNVFCPRRDERSELVVAEPTAERAAQLQQRMIDLLYGDGEAAQT